MRIHYWSSNSRNTAALADKLTTPTIRLGDDTIDDYTVLMTPTYEMPKQGDFIPRAVRRWLGRNGRFVIGVIGTGNLSFGHTYCQAAHDIANALQVPVLYRCELMGTPADIAAIDTGLRQHWKYLQHLRHTGATA